MIEQMRLWLRGVRLLRFRSVVNGLGEMKTEWDRIQVIRDAYAGRGVRIHRAAVLDNWAPEKLLLDEVVAIDRGTILFWGDEPGQAPGLMQFGAHTWIGPYNNFRTSGAGTIRLGKRCYVSQFCTFVSHNHGTRRDTPMQLQGHDQSRSDITVGDDVWFGVGTAVLPGVTIGEGAVIGAGSVVNQSVPPYEIWAGAPARKIGVRK